MTYTISRTLPTGEIKTATAKTIREAGQSVAFALFYNTRLTKRVATDIAKQAEKTGYAEAAGYEFTITKNA